MHTHVTCTRRLTFEAGHRVYGHESKCSNLHGHSYKVVLTACGPIDSIGRVIDFSVLKQRIGSWIDEYLDHAFLVFIDDTEARRALEQIAGQKIFVMASNPTAENIARYFLEEVCPALLTDAEVLVTKVVVHETENCHATATLSVVRNGQQPAAEVEELKTA